MISRMSANDHLQVEEALAYNIKHGHQKRIGEGHAKNNMPTRIDPRQYANTLPPWLRQALKNTRGDFYELDYLYQLVGEYEGNIRNQQWSKARIIAAVVCATQEAGGDTGAAISGWGLSSSRAWFWVSLARVFPPEYENAQMESDRYHAIFQLAKLECEIKGRPRNNDQWNQVSDTAKEMFEEFETWTLKQLKDLIKEKKDQTPPDVTVEQGETSINKLSFKAYADKSGNIRAVRQGEVMEKLTIADLLKANGLTEQHVDITFTPIDTHKQERLV